MRTVRRRYTIVSGVFAIALLTMEHDTASQASPHALSIAARQEVASDALRRWDLAVDRLLRSGDLMVMSRFDDRTVEGRTQEYLRQYYAGIPVLGGGVSRQLDSAGVTVSLFGTLHQGIDVNVGPALSAAQVGAGMEQLHGGKARGGQPSLAVLPLPNGSYALAYQIIMSDGYFYFAAADDGRLLHRTSAFKSQAAIGVGADLLGKPRKLSTSRADDGFQAYDRLRPGELVTLDVGFDEVRFFDLLLEHYLNFLEPGERMWTMRDVAVDADNDWDDAAVVGAHGYMGWGYDYLAERHGWQGIDGTNGRAMAIVNNPLFSAAMALPPLGPEGTGAFLYGEVGGETWTSLDIVGHELMHGVTHFSVSDRTGAPLGLFNIVPIGARLGPRSIVDGSMEYTCDELLLPGWILTPDGVGVGEVPAWCVDGRFVLASDEAGAIHEGYSDVFAESLGFYYEDLGVAADYLFGGDQEGGPFRSLVHPSRFSDPDLYRDRYEFALTLDEDGFWDYSGLVFVDGQYRGYTGDFGYGGDHWNSLILSHAFYLAVEGGMNRSSGVAVEGVGGANRAEVERIFFRAMTDLMPATATLPLAAAVIRQSASDLDPGGSTQLAIERALLAVGLGPEAGM